MGSHARLSASSAYRWMACPGSIRLSEGIPDETSKYAIEGTAAHSLAERALSEGRPPVSYVGSQITVEVERPGGQELVVVPVTREMADAVTVYTDYVVARAPADDELRLEERLNLEPLDPPESMFGTADCLLWDGHDLEVVDYKHGRGVVVEVEGNPQLRYYALGAILAIGQKPERIRMTVIQPRAHHPDGPIRSVDLTFDDLIEFKRELFEAAEQTQEPDAPLNPGDHCTFCPALATCPAYRDMALEVAKSTFDEYTPPPPQALTTAELHKVLTVSKNLQKWLGAVEEHAIAALERGEDVPGFKLVEGRSNRQWVDEEAADTYLAGKGLKVAERFKKKLVSPNQAEQALKAAGVFDSARKLDKLITKPEGKPTLAPVSDKRPALPPSAIAAFADADDEGTKANPRSSEREEQHGEEE